MIDTGKYEDAQKHAWRDAWGQPYFELNEMQGFISDNGPNSCNDSDVELWADAPLLLAEVKRLREGRLDLINEVVRIINNKTGERVDADLHDYIIDRLVNE